MDKDKVCWYSPLSRLVSSCFCISEVDNSVEDPETALTTGPEATMVRAAKHFSTAHKVNFG
ncbi:hypothetical protein FRX31_020240 [Thalictrum thalictroides]|uniref:Uncharacterized protein n=1 Tax=Thalictrum thalictroides TaxID=46969 RepID=A0A7J6W0P7_THATH|nr:hypothetical protein FRX31_020240 [Thalictrum thalictroides]